MEAISEMLRSVERSKIFDDRSEQEWSTSKVLRSAEHFFIQGTAIHGQGSRSPGLLARQMIAGHLPNTTSHRNFCSLDDLIKNPNSISCGRAALRQSVCRWFESTSGEYFFWALHSFHSSSSPSRSPVSVQHLSRMKFLEKIASKCFDGQKCKIFPLQRLSGAYHNYTWHMFGHMPNLRGAQPEKIFSKDESLNLD